MQRSTALFCVLLVAGRAEAFLHGAPLLRLSRAAAPAAPRCLQPPRMVASPGKGDTAGGQGRQGGEVVEGPFRGQVKDVDGYPCKWIAMCAAGM